VTDIGVDLLGNLVGFSPFQVGSPSLQNGGSGNTPEKILKINIQFGAFLVYQDNSGNFYHFSGQLNISGQIQDINEISGITGISGHVYMLVRVQFCVHNISNLRYSKEGP